MFGWFKQPECKYRCLTCERDIVSVEPAPIQAPKEVVALTSPARALEQSLTSPETRDEWTSEWVQTQPLSYGGYTKYHNAKRDILITVVTGFGTPTISTPFTLNSAEQDVVREALATFRAYNVRKRELAALSRLTASGIETGTAKTEGLGPKDESPAPKADAQP